MLKKYFLLIPVLTVLCLPTKAQEMWGISNSNFSGNMGIFLNPSTIVGAPYQYEINLAALDLFAENTNIYVLESDKYIFHSLTGYARDGRNFFTRSPQLNNSFGHGLLIGPSYIRNKTTSGWGIHSALRTEVSTLKMSPEVALLLSDNFRSPILYGDTITSPAFKNAYASWIEIGGTYGKILRESEYHIIKWAATGNILIGMNAFYADNKSLSFTSVDSSQVLIHAIDQTIGHSINDNGGSIFGLRGLGLSTTVGLTYINHPNRGAFDCNMSNDKQKKYKYRLGFSLLDLGNIFYFNKTRKTELKATTTQTWNGVDSFAFVSFQSLDTNLVNIMGGETKSKNFNMWLPLGGSIQFDYQIRANLFANLSWVNRIRFTANEIARGNQINASVRYERRRYEANVNFSFFEYKRPSMGVGLRYRFFVIGSDRLLQTLGLADEKSFDLFVGLKFQFCKRPFSPGPDCPAYMGGN
jgi:hypothetical protein